MNKLIIISILSVFVLKVSALPSTNDKNELAAIFEIEGRYTVQTELSESGQKDVEEWLKPIQMSHLEIPADILDINFAKRLDPLTRDSLLFQKNGKLFVRWILNPQDRHYGLKLKKFLEHKGLDSTIYHRFIGRRTASRTVIVHDPINNTNFATKTSTNKTLGEWQNKYLDFDQAADARLYADYLDEQNKKYTFENFVIMDEPASISTKIQKWSINDGKKQEDNFRVNDSMIIRDISPLHKDSKIYLPFFACFSKFGTQIAELNGEPDIEKFWTEHGLKVVARGIAELAIKTGLQHDSPHSQNFLIELDENYKPTGRLVIRDLTDFYINQNILKQVSKKADFILEKLKDKSHIHDSSLIAFKPFLGSHPPTWLLYEKVDQWQKLFGLFFEDAVTQMTHTKKEDISVVLKEAPLNKGTDRTYRFDGPAYADYFKALSVAQPSKNLVMRCEGLF